MYILDTDICSYIIKHRPAEVLRKFDSIAYDELHISVITQAELLFGAKKLGSQQLIILVENFIARLKLLPWQGKQAFAYANLRNNLEKSGTAIGNMDLMIASHALSLNATLVTNNTKYFAKVPDLRYENWVLGT